MPMPVPETRSFTIDILTNHLLPNTPFLLARSSTSHWLARADWALPSSPPTAGPSRPNLAALRRYAHHVVPVADTRAREFSEFARAERPLGEVLDAWETGRGEGLYVKDWHLVAEIEQEGGCAGEVYEPPNCLRDDWLNPPFRVPPASTASAPTTPTTAPAQRASLADFRFTYLGPAGTFTPLHRDVYASYSWSANVVGRKVWWLFPPGDEPRDARGETVFDVRAAGGLGGGVNNDGCGGFKVLQEEGEVIFVPSGWYHQVVNVDFCSSINHNFFSSPTLPRIIASMSQSQLRVEQSIADVRALIVRRLGSGIDPDGVPAWEREWGQEVQDLLVRDAGWGWAGFWNTVERNIENPPAHGPPRAQRDAFIREAMDAYRSRRDYTVLFDVRAVVERVAGLLGSAE
ncbi:hypothetical protein Q5752_003256 [Cryptotrichosporon argae]